MVLTVCEPREAERQAKGLEKGASRGYQPRLVGGWLKRQRNVTLGEGSHLCFPDLPGHSVGSSLLFQDHVSSSLACSPQIQICLRPCSALMPCSSVCGVLPGRQEGSLRGLRSQRGTVQQAQLPVLRAAAPLPPLAATQPALSSTTKECLGSSCSL